MTNASIITIGDELLIGQVIDTNSALIAQQMNNAGFVVTRRVAVGDDYEAIETALSEEKKHSDIILITGGLGPTADDITKPLLCKYFGGKMIVNDVVLENITAIFKAIKKQLTSRNIKQAEVPDVCTVLPNKIGTAPGMVFYETINKTEKVFISMPGVPQEMKGIMVDEVIPLLQAKYKTTKIEHRTLLCADVGESTLADILSDFEEKLPLTIKLAYLPNYSMVRLRLTEIDALKSNIGNYFIALQNIVKEYLVTTEDESMEQVLGKLLKVKGKTMCTAESCTGGYIAHLITSIAGSSSFYDGSVISYSYQAKEDLVHVNNITLIEKGAVSEDVVKEMAAGVLKNIHSDYAIAVSGIMGPDGGLPDKPVGTVWICVGSKNNLKAHKFRFRYDRELNIKLTATNALNMLRKFILDEED
ncbi:MAG: CinA family nicotinamide mononucleotide deamidase-related protein [Ferruginibacter sp.]|nr:CinA family nicotinamide mononucleotide deamidase-related protein [Ferruginibacter sp.]